MKNFFKKLFYFITPIIIMLVSVNYFVDPGNIFYSFSYEKGISKILCSGKNVAGLFEYDEEMLQKLFIPHIKTKNNIIVVGSSRVFGININLPKYSFFNNGVPGAFLKDYMAIYWLYYKNRIEPKIIIMGLDPWIVNKNAKKDSSLEFEYNKMQMLLKTKSKKNYVNLYFNIYKYKFNKYLQLFSLSYFQGSFSKMQNDVEKKQSNYLTCFKEYIKNKITGQVDYYATLNEYENVTVKLKNGVYHYNKSMRNRSIQDVNKEAVKYVTGTGICQLERFSNIDPVLAKQLNDFFDFMQSRGVKIIIYLPPYHPISYNFLVDKPQYRIIEDVENYFRNIAKEKGMPVIGSYNPVSIGFKNTDFYDGAHAHENAVNKLFSDYFKKYSEYRG
jgi:hypothetical protein